VGKGERETEGDMLALDEAEGHRVVEEE